MDQGNVQHLMFLTPLEKHPKMMISLQKNSFFFIPVLNYVLGVRPTYLSLSFLLRDNAHQVEWETT